MRRKICHMSIDDVTVSFQNLSKSEYSSIFEVNLFRILLSLHRLLGLKITLYVYTQNNEWTLADISEMHKPELENASEWLKFGFHAVSDEQKEDNILSNFEDAFVEAERQIRHFAGEEAIARILRLHYWFYPKAYQGVLKNHGVHTVLIKEGQQVDLWGLNQWITSIRIEQDTMKQIIYKISHCKTNQPLVVFTHEWALNRKNKVKFALTTAFLRLKGYQFICE